MNTKKPTPPEGHEVMLGKDVPDPVPIDTKVWVDVPRVGWMWAINGYEKLPEPRQSYWYAVPVQTPALPLTDENSTVVFSSDPKKSQGDKKPQLQLIPPALNDETAKALARGAEKYGVFNWRKNNVEVMTYLGAMKRHIDKFLNGEDIDPDTGAHHLGCAAAGCGIVLDARQYGTLVDNRPPPMQTA